MTELAAKQCMPCQGDVPPLDDNKTQELLAQLDGWGIEHGYHLSKSLEFPDFVSALDFVNKIGALAEEQGHHPDIHLAWGQVKIEVWTHKINGLTESDFIYAAKVDQLTTKR